MVTITLFMLCMSAVMRVRLTLSIFDPLNLTFVKEIVMVSTIFFGLNDYIPNDFFIYFVLSYVCWLCILGFCSIYASNYYRSVDNFFSYVERYKTSTKIINIIYLFTLSTFVFVGFSSGGDQRLSLFKQLRILEPFLIFGQIIVLYLLSYRYLYSKSLLYLIMIVSLLSLNIIIGGKSAILSIFFTVNFLIFRQHILLNFRKFLLITFLGITGVVVSVVYNYDADGILAAINLLADRVRLDSDIYLLYFALGHGQNVEVNSGVIYVLGPLFKLIGLGDIVPVNIGAQLSSIIWSAPLITGPNAHLPFVLYSAPHAYNVFLTVAVYLILPLFIQVKLIGGKIKNFLGASLVVFYIFIFNRYFFDPPAYTLMLIELFIFYSTFLIIRSYCHYRAK